MAKNNQRKQKAQAKRATKRNSRSKMAKSSGVQLRPPQSILSLLPQHTRKAAFSTFAETVSDSWNKTYLIARGRPINASQMRIAPLGTGFLCGKQRMLTCAHCIINDSSQDAMAKHQDGDVYFFVSRNGQGNFHSSQITDLKINKNLFVYPDVDASVIELPESFYTNGKEVFKHPDDHFILANDMIDIGSDVGVIGYPFQQIRANPEQAGIDITGVLVRVDKGVINTNYKDAATQLLKYEFTISFNPGNSGGPIICPEDGKVIAWVRGFNSMPLEIQEGDQRVKIYAHYSEGISTVNLKDIASKHGLTI